MHRKKKLISGEKRGKIRNAPQKEASKRRKGGKDKKCTAKRS